MLRRHHDFAPPPRALNQCSLESMAPSAGSPIHKTAATQKPFAVDDHTLWSYSPSKVKDHIVPSELSRRSFLSHAGSAVSAAWVSAHWPQMLSAAAHARRAAQSSTPHKFEFLTPDEALEVDTLAACIIPSEDSPGAREAGVLFFIDRALVTFASSDQPKYRAGILDLQAHTRQKFPAVQKFSAASIEQQDDILRVIDQAPTDKVGRRRNLNSAQTFFEVIRVHTISGFLIDPDAETGNRGGVGWKLIGREPEHMFQPPFGYYDKNYPGWQPAPKAAEKK